MDCIVWGVGEDNSLELCRAWVCQLFLLGRKCEKGGRRVGLQTSLSERTNAVINSLPELRPPTLDREEEN